MSITILVTCYCTGTSILLVCFANTSNRDTLDPLANIFVIIGWLTHINRWLNGGFWLAVVLTTVKLN